MANSNLGIGPPPISVRLKGSNSNASFSKHLIVILPSVLAPSSFFASSSTKKTSTLNQIESFILKYKVNIFYGY